MREDKTLAQLKDSRLLYDKKVPTFGYIIILIVVALLTFLIIWSVFAIKIDIIKATGIVESIEKNYVMSQFPGEIYDYNLSEGQVVDKGDVLFKVKSSDINVQYTQLEEQKKIYTEKIAQYQKLVKSIEDDKNYFSPSKQEDSLYYNQFELYKSQVEQNKFDSSTYKSYGYSDEQIKTEAEKNQAKIVEVYHNALISAENSLQDAIAQSQGIDAQLLALDGGKNEYNVTATESGVVHLMSTYDNGMVIQQGTPVASIAQANTPLQVVVNVPISDFTRVEIGDNVNLQVAGLSSSVYGDIKGVVENMDTDITYPQTSQGEEEGTSPYYKVYVSIENDYLTSENGKIFNVINGTTVEARIEYDEITYFNYVLDSLGVLVR